jgi:transcriptional regulator with XRE-family HTH domain
LREDKKLSQGDIDHRCGLLRRYISRVENGHTVPNVETLEKWVGRWKFRSARSSMMVSGRLHCLTSRIARPPDGTE